MECPSGDPHLEGLNLHKDLVCQDRQSLDCFRMLRPVAVNSWLFDAQVVTLPLLMRQSKRCCQLWRGWCEGGVEVLCGFVWGGTGREEEAKCEPGSTSRSRVSSQWPGADGSTNMLQGLRSARVTDMARCIHATITTTLPCLERLCLLRLPVTLIAGEAADTKASEGPHRPGSLTRGRRR